MSSIPDIVTIGQMIDSAFGDPEKNVVHHKLIQAVLIILARQLRILDRRVKLELFNNPDFYSSGSSLSVTEVKIQAIKKKRRTVKPASATARGKGPSKGGVGPTGQGQGPSRGIGPEKGPSEETGPERGKSPRRGLLRATAETIEDYAKGHISITKIKTRSLPSDPKRGTVYTSRVAMLAESDSAAEDRGGGTGRITFLGEEHSSSTDKYSTSASDQVTTEKTSTEKSSTEKSSTEKSSTEKSSTEKSSTEKSTTDKTTTESPTDKTSTSSDKTKTTSTDQTSTEKSITEKSTTDTSKSSSVKTTATSPGKAKTDTITETDETKSTTSSTLKPTKSPPAKTTPSSTKPMKTTSSDDKRADSREERDKTPTPMASMDSVEVQYEKLLVVERIPSEEAKARIGRLQGETRGSVPKLSIVTQEEFSKLATEVRKLQAKFDPVGMAEFPENLKLMQELRKGASLTDAMAALQLSARLEAAEKGLGRMISLVTELASKYSEIDLTLLTGPAEPETEVLYHGAPGPSFQTPPRLSKTPAFKQPPKPKKSKSKKLTSSELIEEDAEATTGSAPSEKGEDTAATATYEEEKEDVNCITAEQLENALQEVYDNLMASITGVINKSKTNSETALKVAKGLEGKLDASLDLGDRMSGLETLVANYADKINELDTGLSSQMTNYQELLTQMQHDLECGLENMAEALATTGGDTTAVAELNSHFTNLQLDFETTNSRQNELSEIQTALRSELEELRKQIEILRGTKSDRDEVSDALRDKVGLGTLNGLISLEQFDAVRGDLEQRIGAAYDKFNNQELVWQKAIDDIYRELSEKADWTQVVFLREDIKKNIEKLKNRIQAMLDIVGEPQAAAVSRRLHRDTNCLSCSTPAHMGLEENTIPNLPAMPGARPPTLGAESPQKHNEHDQGVCYPNLPIPHLREPRAHICHRYCGGSHTKMPTTIARAPVSMLINQVSGQGPGNAKTDGKVIKKPCIPCNVKPKATNDIPNAEIQDRKISYDGIKEDEESIGGLPADLIHMASLKSERFEDSIGETPPVPQDED